MSDHVQNNGNNIGFFTETIDKNALMRAFLSDTILSPSCYDSPVKQGKSYSDITIAGFWGNNIVDHRGCGLIILNTEKGIEDYMADCSRLDVISKDTNLEDAICIIVYIGAAPAD